MVRIAVSIMTLLALMAPAAAQTPPATTVPSAQTAPPGKPAAKKATAKPKAPAKPADIASTGPCRLGVISAIGDRFSVEKFGLTVFETEFNEVSIDDWGLDDIVLARVRAAAGADPAIRKVSYPKGAFEPFYNPKSRLIPDPSERLPAIVRGITPNANCERYLVVTRFKTELQGSSLTLDGIGAYSRGLGSFARHSHLFANIAINLIDGRSYEQINRNFANFGSNLSESLRFTEDPMTKLDNSQFPDPPAAASSNVTLRERTRALVATRLDRTLPGYLEED
ncbi:hypothetical protein [Bradyrhizobium sp. 1]|uniref:hypothetical protein n=1 Tax=Bradyrhizobium sp. 1 TaxID=241591 RepID=UPI001FFB069B|nr:hypothetical protein [Bradyrhizobium sp. 1]MCK1393176.1 hypothetical protein [Bradyrhizobium sp. 1]